MGLTPHCVMQYVSHFHAASFSSVSWENGLKQLSQAAGVHVEHVVVSDTTGRQVCIGQDAMNSNILAVFVMI